MIETLSKLINLVNSDQPDQPLTNFENMGVQLYSKDRNGRYLACNEEMLCIAGLTRCIDIVGHNDFDFIWSEEAALMIENDQKIISKDKSMLFIEPSIRFNGCNYIKTHLLSYKRPLRTHNKRIIGISGLSFILNEHEIPLNIPDKHASLVNIESYDKFTFYSNLEKKYNLSMRQKECLYYLTKGMPLKQIARILNLSPRTIEHHLESIKTKLGCFTRTQLIERIHESQRL